MSNSKKPRHISVSNVLLLVLVCLLAFFFYFNLGGAISSLYRQRIAQTGTAGAEVTTTRLSIKETVQMGLRKEDLVWSEEELPAFFLLNLMDDSESPSRDAWMEDCEGQVPSEYCEFLYEAPKRVQSHKDARVFLVPIFESALFSEEGLHGLIEKLTHHRYFMKFRGSDFVFVCYISNCEAAHGVVLSALGKAVRAIWVDRGGTADWPCINRLITVDSTPSGSGIVTDWVAESKRLVAVLQRIPPLIQGRNRWACDSKDAWGLKNPYAFDFATIKDTSFKSVKDQVAYCGVPKVGSSVAVLLMRRMNDMKDWKKSNTVQIRNFHTGYNWTYKGKEDLFQIFDGTQWVKGMLVRDPISRLLSGYRSKIEQLREYSRVPGGWPAGSKPPTLKQFVAKIYMAKQKGNFDWIDRHVRPQSALCGTRSLPFDFIGRYDEREQDMHDFLESLELWDKLGASGWGSDGAASLYSEDEQIVRRNKLKPVTHADSKATIRKYYDRDLVKQVIRLYDEDFTRFGFSKNPDDYL